MESYTQKQLADYKERFINKQVKIKKGNIYSYLQVVDIVPFNGRYYILATDGNKDDIHNFIFGLDEGKIRRVTRQEHIDVDEYFNTVLAKGDEEKVEEQRKRDLE